MTLVVSCDHLFDGHSLHRDALVVVEDGAISAVYPRHDAPQDLPAQAQHLSCHFLMPGLIDSHVHISGYNEGSPAGVPYRPVKHFMRLLIYNGVTSARDTGNAIETIEYCREWGQRYDGPRVFGAGPLLDAPPFIWPFSRIVRTAEDAARHVRLLHLEGMDFVKAYRNITPELLRVIVETASHYGMDVAADVGFPRQACAAGVRSIEHAHNLLDESIVDRHGEQDSRGLFGRLRLWRQLDLHGDLTSRLRERMAERGTFSCPTLLVTHRLTSFDEMVNDPYLDYMAKVMPYHQFFKGMRNKFARMATSRYITQYMHMPTPTKAEQADIDGGLEKLRGMVASLHESGVDLVVGTDSPNPSLSPGFSLHQEMALLAQSGIPALAVLQAATSNAARLLRRDDLGVIRAGACADMLLLDANPLANIYDTKKIKAVVKAGRVIDREKMLGHVEASNDPA